MIDFYTWSTSNGRKVAIGLEEMGLAYRVHPIDIYRVPDASISPPDLSAQGAAA